jgi:replicative DNA helicase
MGTAMNPHIFSMDEWMVRFLDHLMSKANDPSTESSQPSGFLNVQDRDFDALPGTVRVICGNTVDEKTGLLISAVMAASRESHLPVLLFVSEKDEMALAYQLVSAVGQIDRKRLDSAMLSDCEWPPLTDTIEAIRVLPIHIITSTALSLEVIEAEASRLSTDLRQFAVVLVDADGLPNTDQQHELAGGMHRLRKLAQNHKTSVLLFHTMPSAENKRRSQVMDD